MRSKRYVFAALVTVFSTLALQTPPAAAASHSAGLPLIEVNAVAVGDVLPESLVEKITEVSGVSRVEKYLLVPGERNDKIGMEPGAPIRIFADDGRLIESQVEFGRNFRDTDAGKNVALVNGVSYGGQAMTGAMAGMPHFFGVGQSFELAGTRLRVIGEVTAPTQGKIFLPLDTAQRLYGKQGVVTHFFLSVKQKEQAGAVQKALAEALGPTIRTTLR